MGTLGAFRGTATGGGTTRETNQRLALAWQSFEWESSPEHNGSTGADDPLLDAAIVGELNLSLQGTISIDCNFTLPLAFTLTLNLRSLLTLTAQLLESWDFFYSAGLLLWLIA